MIRNQLRRHRTALIGWALIVLGLQFLIPSIYWFGWTMVVARIVRAIWNGPIGRWGA